MSFETERVAITSYLKDNWNETTICRLAYENQDFVQPVGEPFAEFLILNGKSIQASMGGDTNNLFRNAGLVELNIYAPINSGTKKSREIAESFSTLFRNKILATSDGNTITFRVPNYRIIGLTNNWYKTSVSATFYRDELI